MRGEWRIASSSWRAKREWGLACVLGESIAPSCKPLGVVGPPDGSGNGKDMKGTVGLVYPVPGATPATFAATTGGEGEGEGDGEGDGEGEGEGDGEYDETVGEGLGEGDEGTS